MNPRRTAWAALAAVALLFAAAASVWLHLDRAPPLWDEAHYLQESARLYDILRAEGPVAGLRAFSRALGTKAPLITGLPLPLYFLLEESHHTARYVNVAFIFVASWYLFRLGELVAGRRAALLALVLLNTFPLVAGMTRLFLVEYGLMTLVIAWMYYLVRWRLGDRWGPSWALGVLLGAGLLLKVTFPLYVGAPTVLVLVRDWLRNPRHRRALLLGTLRVASVGAPIAGIWYWVNWRQILGFAVTAGYGEAAQGYSKGAVFSAATVAAYWQDLVNYGTSAYGALVVGAAACWVAAGALAREDRSGVARWSLDLLLTWWLVPAVVLTFAVSKEIRFTVPYLPAIALLAGAGWAGPAHRPARLAGIGLIAALGLANFGFYSFDRSPSAPHLEVAGFVLLSRQLEWAHPPASQEWPNESVLALIRSDAESTGIPKPVVTLLFSHPALNAHNMNYLATLRGSAARFRTAHFQSPEPAEELADRVRTESDYVLTKSGSLGGAAINAKNVRVLALLEAGGLPFDPVTTVALPDRTELAVLRAPGPGLLVRREGESASRAVTEQRGGMRFGTGIELVDWEVVIAEEGFRVSLVWRCIGEIGQDLRVFVHLVDPARGPYAAADHVLGRGRYPSSRWRVGDVVDEEAWVPARLPPGHQVYVGLYGPAPGSRLPVTGADPSWTAEPNAVRIH